MRRFVIGVVWMSLVIGVSVAASAKDDCVACHEKETPKIVKDWKLSAHADADVVCGDCHGEGHESADDVLEVDTVTVDT